MKNIRPIKLAFAFLLFICTQISAQTYEWNIPINGNNFDSGTEVLVDNSGNIYSCGQFTGTVDFDPGAGVTNLNGGPGLTYLAKTSPAGNLIWAKCIGANGVGTCGPNSMALDASGNVIISGSFDGSNLDFDPGAGTHLLSTQANPDGFLLKLDASGNFIWVKQFEGIGSMACYAIDFDSQGNMYMAGSLTNTNDMDPSGGNYYLTSWANSGDIVVSSYTSAGAFRWAHIFGSGGNDQAEDMFVNQNDQVVIGGYFETYDIDIDPSGGVTTLTNAGATDAFMAIYSSGGSFVSAGRWGGSGYDFLNTLTETSSGQILVAGIFVGTIDADPGPGVTNLTAAAANAEFLFNLSNTGTYIWSKVMDGTGAAIPSDIARDGMGNIYLLGNLNGTKDLDPGPGTQNFTSLGSYDVYISRYDSSGNYIWAGLVGGTGLDDSRALALKGSQALYFTGFFVNTVDFDAGAGVANFSSNGGTADAYVCKYSLCLATASSISPDVCDSYTSPSGLNTWNVSGTYQDILTNATGCDSVITINLTIRNSSNTSLNAVVCDAYTFFGNTLTASGVYNHTLTNAVGCDSIITLNLTVNHSNTATINPFSCGPATINGTTYNTSGTYNQLLATVDGCDSTLTINLTVNQASSGTTTQTSCGPATINGTTYNASGTYNQLLTNAAGCDSSLTINLTVNQPSSSSLTQSACGSFTLNGTTYNSSGTFTQTLINAVGCDSTLTLFLTITNVNTGVTLNVNTLTASASGATYQWLDCDNAFAIIPGQTSQSFTATQSGNYAVIVTQTSCTDTSACTNVTIAGTQLSLTNESISLFPNPTSGNVTLLFSHPTSNVNVRIFSVNGAMIMEKHWNEMTSESFSIDGVAGIYLAEISCDGKSPVWMKVVKN